MPRVIPTFALTLLPAPHNSHWAGPRDLSLLSKREIDAYLSDPHKKSGDLQKAYKIAQDPTDWNEQQNSIVRAHEAALEEAEEEEMENEDQLEEDDEEDEEAESGKKRKRAGASGKVRESAEQAKQRKKQKLEALSRAKVSSLPVKSNLGAFWAVNPVDSEHSDLRHISTGLLFCRHWPCGIFAFLRRRHLPRKRARLLKARVHHQLHRLTRKKTHPPKRGSQKRQAPQIRVPAERPCKKRRTSKRKVSFPPRCSVVEQLLTFW